MRQLLPANLAALTSCAADDQTRYSMCGIRVRLNENGYIAEATDGRRLLRVDGDYPEPVEDFPGDIPSTDDGPREVVLATPRLKTIVKRIKKRVARKVLKCVAIGTTEKESTLIVDDLENRSVDTARHMDGRYPDTDAVWPKDAAKVTVHVNATLLASTLKAIADLGLKDGVDRVTIEIHGNEKCPMIQINATTAEGQTVKALVMPLTD
jgi:hypothetical protein